MSPGEEAMINNLVDTMPKDGKTFGARTSLRDHFACLALHALLSREDTGFRPGEATLGEGYASLAYAVSDAMLAERAKVRP